MKPLRINISQNHRRSWDPANDDSAKNVTATISRRSRAAIYLRRVVSDANGLVRVTQTLEVLQSTAVHIAFRPHVRFVHPAGNNCEHGKNSFFVSSRLGNLSTVGGRGRNFILLGKEWDLLGRLGFF
jgi:hypothetical protein